jgi:hypothetical protein
MIDTGFLHCSTRWHVFFLRMVSHIRLVHIVQDTEVLVQSFTYFIVFWTKDILLFLHV